MIVFTVMYPDEPGKHFDMDYYISKHFALVKEKAGDTLKAMSVDRGLSGGAPGSPAAYRVISRLTFECMEDFAACMAPYSPLFDADVPNFTDITPRFQISEVIA